MGLYPVYCSIRCQAEGNLTLARELGQAEGLKPNIIELVARAAEASTDTKPLEASCCAVLSDPSSDAFWEAAAAQLLGELADTNEREEYLTRAVDIACYTSRWRPGVSHASQHDRAFVYNEAYSFLHAPNSLEFIQLVDSMIARGVWSAPRTAERLMRYYASRTQHEDVRDVVQQLQRRQQVEHCYFSPSYLAKVIATYLPDATSGV